MIFRFNVPLWCSVHLFTALSKSLFHVFKMPGRKRSYSKSKLPYGIYQVAKSAARASQYADRVRRVQEAAAIMGEAAGVAGSNLGIRREAAKTYGRGMYTGEGKYGLRRTIGQFLKKNHVAQRAFDATAGRVLGSGMYTGMGEYEGPDANDLLSTKSTMDVVPLFASETDEGIIYSKREYVSEIYGPPLVGGVPQPFVLQSFAINPGLEQSFPWLSQIAANFDEYELQQLCFTFKSTTTESGNQTNGQVGTVIMATNYNAAAANFSEKFTMMQYASACSGRLTESLQHFVECDPDKLSGSRGEYVRTNPVAQNQDLKTYDHGKFQIAIANCTSNLANQSLGELWVTYTVKLRKPKFFTGKGLAISKDIFVSNTGEQRTRPFGNSLLRGQQNNIGCSLTQDGTPSFKITFPASYAGSVKMMFTAQVSDLGSGAASPTTVTGNVTPIADLYGATGSGSVADGPEAVVTNYQQANAVPAIIAIIFIVHFRIQIATNGIDNTVTFNMPSTNGAWLQSYLEINEINTGFSYASNNLGPSDAPVLVNDSGVIVVPV